MSEKRNHMKAIPASIRFISLLSVCALSLHLSDCQARKIKLSLKTNGTKEHPVKAGKKETRRGLRIEGIRMVASESCRIPLADGDTVTFDPAKVSFSGYEKEAGAARETMLISNHSGLYISGIEMTVTYLDMSGRMLHSRKITKKCDVPPGETRMFDYPTWDRQKTYYYHLGNSPRKVATPYDVKVSPIAFWIKTDEIETDNKE